MSAIRAVSFDAGGTLIEPWPSVGHVYAEVAEEFGLKLSPATLNEQFAAAWRSRAEFDYTQQGWFGIVSQTFGGSCSVSPALFDSIYERFGRRHCWLIYEDVIPALQQLEAAGVTLCVVSNWDERLRPLLEELGLATYFAEIVISSEVGAHKPSAQIFRQAVASLRCHPTEVLHVGDNTREDVEGAAAAGLRAMRIRRSGATEPYDIEQLTQLIDKLDD